MNQPQSKRRYRSLANKLLVPFILLIVSSLAAVGVVLILVTRQEQQKAALDQQTKTAEALAISISSYVENARDSARVLAYTLGPTMAQDFETRQAALKRLWQARPEVFEELTLLDLEGNEVSKVSRFHTFLPAELTNHADDPAFQRARAGEEYLSDEAYISPFSTLPVVTTAMPVYDAEQNQVGVLIAQVSVKVMWDAVSQVQIGRTGYAYVMDLDQHRLLAHTTLSRFFQLQDADISSVPIVAQIIEGGGGEVQAFSYAGLEGEEVVGAAIPVQGTDWFVIVELPVTEAFAGIRQLMWLLVAMLLAVTAVAVGLGVFLPRPILVSFQRLRQGAATLGSGQLDYVIDLRTGDELEALADEFNAMAGRLRELYEGLEEKVAERTRELERRAVHLQAAAEVGRAAASLLNLDELLPQVTRLISQRFGFYHVGIFLLDETGEYAVLRAANSEGGQRMLAQGHRLKVGEQGIVGYVTGTARPRIALDVGADAVHFKNPLLPHTRSELALPLMIGGRVLGALDVQSTEEAAFTEEDVAVLQVLADQVAVAIENARLFAETQAALEMERRIYGEVSRRAWSEMLHNRPHLGFRSDEHGVTSAAHIWRPEMEQALQEGRTVQISHLQSSASNLESQTPAPREHNLTAQDDADGKAVSPLAVPIKVRGQVIGVLDACKPDEAGGWTAEEVTLLEEITEQLGTALESARLFENTLEERDRTALLLEMSQRLGADLDFDAVVETVLSFASRLGAEAAELYLVDTGRDVYFFKSTLPERASLTPEEASDFCALILDKGLEGWVLRERQPALVTDTKLDDRWLILPGHEEEDPVRSVISVPLIAGRRRIQGVLSLTQRVPNAFDHDDLSLAQSLATQAAVAFENADLFQATQTALQETEALYRASRAVATADSMEAILQAVVHHLPSPQVDQCFLGIFDPLVTSSADEVTVVAAWTREGAALWPAGSQVSLVEQFGGRPVTREQPLILGDVAATDWLPDSRRMELLSAGVRSWAVIPLVAAGGWIGVLSVVASRPGEITERNLQPYLTLAGQVALSIERSNLFKQTQEALEETSMLYRASRAIGSAASTSEVAEALLNSVAEGDFDRALVLIRTGNDRLEVIAGWDRSGQSVDVGAQMSVAQAAPELTLYTVPAEGLPDNGTDWRRMMPATAGTVLASVPILFRSRLLGVLLLQSRRGRLSEEALQPFVTLAAQAAVAIENRRLFEETRRAAEEEALLNEMLRNMTTALDVPSVVRTVQESLAQLVPFDFMSVALVNEETSAVEVIHLDYGGSAGTSEVRTIRQVLPLEESLTGQAIGLRQSAIFDLSDQSVEGVEVARLRHTGVQSLVILPLVYGRNVLGSLNLAHRRRDAYATDDLPLLERVAQLMAVALENARLFGQVSQRAVQLQTAAEVSQAATSILKLEELLPRAVELIRDRFDLYYVGVFLVDETGEWAVLKAGTGEAGRIQLEQGHRLKVGGESMIGWCVANARARVALDVGEEAVHFDNPLLPDTRSEMALPLISRGQVIGGLTVQSTRPAAFSREDLTTLQTMADQLANAIQNARLYDEVQIAYARTKEERDRLQLLHDTMLAIEQAASVEHKLKLIAQGLQGVGYGRVVLTLRDDQMRVTHLVTAGLSQEEEAWLREHMWPPEMWQQRLSGEFEAFRLGRCYYLPWTDPRVPSLVGEVLPSVGLSSGSYEPDRWHPRDLLYLPLYDSSNRLFGIINLDAPADGRRPTSDSLRIVELFAQEAALALENARLLEQAQRRARREALIRQITSKVRSSVDVDTILQTTITEVARALGTPHGAIRLVAPESVPRGGSGSGNGGESRRPSSPADGQGADTSPEAGSPRGSPSPSDEASASPPKVVSPHPSPSEKGGQEL